MAGRFIFFCENADGELFRQRFFRQTDGDRPRSITYGTCVSFRRKITLKTSSVQKYEQVITILTLVRPLGSMTPDVDVETVNAARRSYSF